MTDKNLILKAINQLELKLTRQLEAVKVTQAQLTIFKDVKNK